MDVTLRMMAALIADVGFDPFQIFCPETDDSVTGLPFEDFSAAAEALVDVVGGGAF